MKLAALSVAGETSLLCVEADGTWHPVGREGARFTDVAGLLHGGGASLVDAIRVAGVEERGLSGARVLAPIRPPEVWAAGVTYERSREARMLESTEMDIYDRIYDAERPELFFKATANRVVGPGDPVGLRGDSQWQVPEPELAAVLGASGEVVGYTLGNDMSSRDIEGANPLYLPQAKIFAGSCALGPVVVTADEIDDPYDLPITMRIVRGDSVVYEGETSTQHLHKRLDVLVEYLCRDNWIEPGTVLLTGTGIVPPDDFTLEIEDAVEIGCPPIGTLRNVCAPASSLAPPS